MTNKKIFQLLVELAEAFGWVVKEVPAENLPPIDPYLYGLEYGLEGTVLGYNQASKRGRGGKIFLRKGLLWNMKPRVLSHEMAHLFFKYLKIKSHRHQPVTHEPLADLFSLTLIAALKGKWNDPVFQIYQAAYFTQQFFISLRIKQNGSLSPELQLILGRLGKPMWRKKMK